ncbi:MAG: Ldh family oxidoreductase [Clostridia bacterium]|nr:Ldh family oxidoreductase [Clostridia bacterium]
MGNSINYSYQTLKTFCTDAFMKFGFSKEESDIIVDVLLTSDLYGIESHGMQRLVRYHKGIEKGLIKIGAKPEIVFETPVSAVIEGNDGMGQLLGYKAMNLAIEKAKQTGMAIVTVRNSNHYGIAGYYAKMACKEGLIGMSMTNSEAIMVPTFGRKAMLGSNPIAIAMPAEPYDFFFDASTTVVTRGKLEIYNKLNKPLPEGWALGASGKGSSDASDVLKNIVAKAGGGIVPLGGETEQSGSHKGYGYGMFCEIFTSILSMGLTSNHTHIDGKGGTCHGFIAINPAVFGDADAIREHLSTLLRELRESPKAEGQDRIYTHGEKEVFAYEDRLKNGINVNINTVAEMVDLCNYLGMDVKEYLGEEAQKLTLKQSSYDM